MASSVGTYINHPCFGVASRRTKGRLHLPVASRANARIKFSAPGKARQAMQPEVALTWLRSIMDSGTEIDIVGVTGPGDPLATPESTIKTLRLVREAYPDLDLCLTTVGIGGAAAADDLSDIGLSHVTLLVDAVSVEVAERLYAWIRPATKTVPLKEAAGILIREQADAVTALSKAGITVKVNTTVYPGINAGHVEEIASTMAGLGAAIMAVCPHCPGNEAQTDLGPTDAELLATVRDHAARHMELMPAWDECGEDMVGTEKMGPDVVPAAVLPKPTKERPNVAVVSSNGMEVDLHLGHAVKVLVYGPREDGLNCLLETRHAPEPGGGARRWEKLARVLDDCFVLLAASAGEKPKEVLARKGIAVLVTDQEIEGTVDALYGGGKKKGKKRS